MMSGKSPLSDLWVSILLMGGSALALQPMIPDIQGWLYLALDTIDESKWTNEKINEFLTIQTSIKQSLEAGEAAAQNCSDTQSEAPSPVEMCDTISSALAKYEDNTQYGALNVSSYGKQITIKKAVSNNKQATDVSPITDINTFSDTLASAKYGKFNTDSKILPYMPIKSTPVPREYLSRLQQGDNNIYTQISDLIVPDSYERMTIQNSKFKLIESMSNFSNVLNPNSKIVNIIAYGLVIGEQIFTETDIKLALSIKDDTGREDFLYNHEKNSMMDRDNEVINNKYIYYPKLLGNNEGTKGEFFTIHYPITMNSYIYDTMRQYSNPYLKFYAYTSPGKQASILTDVRFIIEYIESV